MLLKKIKYLTVSVLLSALFLTSCVDPPDYSEVPEIEFITFSPQLVGTEDTLQIVFFFKDGDGDLGFESFSEPDSLGCDLCDSTCFDEPEFSIFVTRNKTGCLIPFNMPYIPPKGSSRAISGNVTLSLFDIGCLPPDGGSLGDITDQETDTVYFYIQLKDRAGNFSNVIQTPEITLLCND
ncbi:MAG: hypothetical protein EA412_04035 [Chitinophagaceae bacterium]|nr:MAG: hypothetical protein EA412_04035 [Chitinophagaceae bacterium]